jgi:polyisoprenoid-binding protein YceI
MLLSYKFIIIFLISIFLSLQVWAKDRWILDKNLSTIKFELPVLLMNNVEGKFLNFEGFVEIDLEDYKNNKAIFSATLNSMEMNYTKYKDLLLGDIFFDVKKFPIALVDTKKFSFNSEKEINLEVELTVKGITKLVPLKLEIYLLADELIQLKGHLIFSRTAFNIGKGRWSSTAILRDKASIKTNLFLFKE